MRLRHRSFPYPVVGNADDVPGAGFQATYEVASDREYYYVNVSAACGSKSLNKLIEKGQACLVLHVECGNTMYRRAFEFSAETHRVQIRAADLHGTVELNVMARACSVLSSYKPDGAHPDYGTTAFRIEQGDILAVAEGFLFEAETVHDSLKRIGSIMVVEQSEHATDHPMEVSLNSNKIRILLCENDFTLYGKLKAIPHLTSHLTTTIVLPVLMHALTEMEKSDAELVDLKWCQSLQRRLDELGIADEQDCLLKAQRILDMPIRRALVAAESYSSNIEN